MDILLVKEDMIVYFPLVLFPLVFFPCSFCSGVLPTKKKLNSHIVNMHYVPSKNIFSGQLHTLNIILQFKDPWKSLWEERKLRRHQVICNHAPLP